MADLPPPPPYEPDLSLITDLERGLQPGDWEPTLHRQVHIAVEGQEAEVDEEIADLILACWGAGIATLYSCQDIGRRDGRRVQLCLFADDAERFLSVVAPPYDDDLDSFYMRAVGGSQNPPGGWTFSHSLGDEATTDQLGADVRFRISVEFPFDDLEEVVARLHRYEMPVRTTGGRRRARTEDQCGPVAERHPLGFGQRFWPAVLARAASCLAKLTNPGGQFGQVAAVNRTSPR